MSDTSKPSSPPSRYAAPRFDTPDLIAFRESWIAACWVTCAIAILVVVLRLLARATKRGSAGWDDWTIVIALVLAIGDTISNTFQVACATFSPCFSSASITSEELNSLSLGFMRLSICIFVLRLLPPNSRATKYAAWFAIVLNLAATVVCIAAFAALNPYSTHKAIPTPELSMTLNRTFMVAGVLSIITDFITVLIPISVIRSVQLNRKTKVGACAILCLGLVTACLSIGKLIATQQTHHDSPINIIRIQIFADLEQNLGIIFASCPALRQLYGHVEKRIKDSKTESGGSAYSTGSGKRDGSSGLAGVTESKRGVQRPRKNIEVSNGSLSPIENTDLEKGHGFSHTVAKITPVTHKMSVVVCKSAIATSAEEGSVGSLDKNACRYWGYR